MKPSRQKIVQLLEEIEYVQSAGMERGRSRVLDSLPSIPEYVAEQEPTILYPEAPISETAPQTNEQEMHASVGKTKQPPSTIHIEIDSGSTVELRIRNHSEFFTIDVDEHTFQVHLGDSHDPNHVWNISRKKSEDAAG